MRDAQRDNEGMLRVVHDLLLVFDVLHLLEPHHLRLLHDLQRLVPASVRVSAQPYSPKRARSCEAQGRRVRMLDDSLSASRGVHRKLAGVGADTASSPCLQARAGWLRTERVKHVKRFELRGLRKDAAQRRRVGRARFFRGQLGPRAAILCAVRHPFAGAPRGRFAAARNVPLAPKLETRLHAASLQSPSPSQAKALVEPVERPASSRLIGCEPVLPGLRPLYIGNAVLSPVNKASARKDAERPELRVIAVYTMASPQSPPVCCSYLLLARLRPLLTGDTRFA